MKHLSLIFLLTFTVISISVFYATRREEVNSVILMIGDGMGYSHIAMTMYSQDSALHMFKAQYGGALITNSANNRVTDSAASATALATGHKTNNSYLGMTPDGTIVNSLLKASKDAAMSTGLITTVSLTHATPAAFYANVKSRGEAYTIAKQLLDERVDIAIGGGARYFKQNSDKKINLVADFEQLDYEVVFDKESAFNVTDRKLLALLADDALGSMISGREELLAEATVYTMNRLKTMSKRGFFMMVEGAQIDYRAHANSADGVIQEVIEFDNAVKEAFAFADENPGTLVVVVADHETGGLTLPSFNKDFLTSEKGLNYTFSTGGHTAGLVPMLAYGTGAEKFSGIIDNTEIPKIIANLLNIKM